MTAPAPQIRPVLIKLDCLGIRLRSDGDKLKARPAVKITDDVAGLIREHRDALLEHIRWCEQNGVEIYNSALKRWPSGASGDSAKSGGERPFDDDISDVGAA